MKELAATHAEIEAVKKVEEENFGSIKEDQSLPTDNCSEEQLESCLLSQVDSILDAQPFTPPTALPKDKASPRSLPSALSNASGTKGTFTTDLELKPLISTRNIEAPHLSKLFSEGLIPANHRFL